MLFSVSQLLPVRLSQEMVRYLFRLPQAVRKIPLQVIPVVLQDMLQAAMWLIRGSKILEQCHLPEIMWADLQVTHPLAHR